MMKLKGPMAKEGTYKLSLCYTNRTVQYSGQEEMKHIEMFIVYSGVDT